MPVIGSLLLPSSPEQRTRKKNWGESGGNRWVQSESVLMIVCLSACLPVCLLWQNKKDGYNQKNNLIRTGQITHSVGHWESPTRESLAVERNI
jgi:hypothetical protein